jgi:NADH-quinone oxidoreductase subunit G
MRVVARENTEVNETWISDRDRFGYTGLNHADRLTTPRMRVNGEWKVVSWEQALEATARGLQSVIQASGVDKVGALASPNATVEEFYLLQKLMRALGVPHLDHRLRDVDTRDQTAFSAFPGLPLTLAQLTQCDGVLLIGSNLQKEQPVAALRLRQMIAKGGVALAVNPMDYRFNFAVKAKSIVAPHQMIASLEALLKALETKDQTHPLAAEWLSRQKGLIIVGALANHHPEAATIRALAKRIAEISGATVGVMTDGANSAGAWLAGMIPHRDAHGRALNHAGMSATDMLQQPRKAYVLLNVEPEFDTANPGITIEALKQAQMVVALSLYRNPTLDAHADVILPIAAFAESAGTFVNAMGHWQSFQGVANPVGEARPAWKVLRVLGHFLSLNGFDYESADEVRDEVRA